MRIDQLKELRDKLISEKALEEKATNNLKEQARLTKAINILQRKTRLFFDLKERGYSSLSVADIGGDFLVLLESEKVKELREKVKKTIIEWLNNEILKLKEEFENL